MKIPRSGAFALPSTATCAVLAGLLALVPAAAGAAIVSGSTVQFAGTAQVNAGGDILFVSVGPTPAGTDAAVLIGITGNTGSYAGYTVPNPNALPLAPNYIAGFNHAMGGMPPAGTFILMPAVAIGGGEAGPAVGATRFVASSLVTSFSMLDGETFFNAVAQGTLFDDTDGTSIAGTFSLSTQNFDPIAGGVNSFSATLTAGTTVIPIPAAGWVFGSGLLAMIAAARRPKG